MAERKAVNKYYPPDWDPRKGSVNKRVGQHPLRDRAKKLSQGILVIRFELPYNIWCGGCGSHVGMGVRYNAEKTKTGNYYSTPIYKFRMKCHLCDNYFEIQTDPQNHDYVILSGARRKEQRWDPVANGQVVPEDKATQKKLATDPMYKLEHGTDDQQKGKEKVMSLAQIEDSKMSMKDDYILNRMARDKFRTEKKQLKEAAEAERAILDKCSLDIDLVEESEEDRKLAGLMKYSVTSSYEDKQKEKRKTIEQRPLFTNLEPTPSASFRVLPHQRHSRILLSRRGELKEKLGWSLRASYKDPFKTVKKAKGGSLSLSSSPDPLLLGIKLKSSEETKSKAKTRSNQTDLLSDESSLQSSAFDLSNKLESDVNNIDFKGTLNNNIKESTGPDLKKVPSTGGCSDMSTLSLATSPTMQTQNVVSGLDVSSVSPSSLQKQNLNSNSSSCSQPQTIAGETEVQDSVGCSDEITSATEESVGVPSSPSISINNSGLQTLMCSYTDSDGESST